MNKILTSLVCSALLAPAVFAQNAAYNNLLSKEANGNAEAAFQLYQIAEKGDLYPTKSENQAAAQRYLFRAADLGSIPARYQVAKTYSTGRVTINAGQKTAFEYLLDLSTRNIGADFSRKQFFEVNYLLGECYEFGRGIQPNMDLAIRYYLFASLDNEDARLALGRIFLRGSSALKIKENPQLAMINFYGVFLLNKNRMNDIVQYLRAANKVNDFSAFLEKRADSGDGTAALFLAEASFSGNVFPKEVTKSLKYYDMAISYGKLEAAIPLGDIYAYGKNFVPVDKDRARALYERALYASDAAIRKEAGKRLVDLAKNDTDAHILFKYMMLSGDYTEARKLIKNQDMTWSAQDIYLKAKEFQSRIKKNDRQAQSDYLERLHMASNAGYFLAVEDYFLEAGSREYSRMILALETDSRPEDPDWLYQLSVCYRSGGTANKLRSYEKSLEYMLKAAEKGHVTAMDLLVKLYTAGAAHYGVDKPNPELAKKYTDMILKYDADMRYPNYFSAYLKQLDDAGTKHSGEDLNPAFRSVEYSPLASSFLAEMYMTGRSEFQIEKDEWTALCLLHLAARQGYRPSIDELIKICTFGLQDIFSANTKFADKYTALIPYLPKYTPPVERTSSAARSVQTKE